MVAALMAIAVLATAMTLAWSARHSLLKQVEYDGVAIAQLLGRSAVYARQVPDEVEKEVGQQMVVQATLAAHLVAIAEAAGLPPDRINAHLRAITRTTTLNEIWITDSRGHAYLRPRDEVDFTFSPDPRRQPQAHAFWPLLTGQKRVVEQAARTREIDDQVYKYVGVAGVDKPRIVDVGYHARLLQRLKQGVGLIRLVDELVGGGNVVAIRIVDSRLATLASGVAPGRSVPGIVGDREARSLWEATREGHTVSHLEGDLLKVMTPIAGPAGPPSAAAAVYLPTDQVHAEVQRQLRLAVGVAFLVLGLGAIGAVALARRVTDPVARLTALTAAVEAESYDAESLAPVARRHDELGQLARGFQQMVREVASREERLKDAEGALRHSEQHFRSLIENALEKLRVSTQRNAETAMQASSLAQQATDRASDGATLARAAAEEITAHLQQLEEAGQSIQEATRQTTRVVGTIDQIAFQTNLLALNAAVEAARAAERGAGFAVVAHEVGELAQRSAREAQSTAQLLGECRTRAEQVGQVVGEVDRAIRQVVESRLIELFSGVAEDIRRVSLLLAEVSAATTEGARGIEQLNGAVRVSPEGSPRALPVFPSPGCQSSDRQYTA
jgi:methyl-accepting chemotaxis protein